MSADDTFHDHPSLERREAPRVRAASAAGANLLVLAGLALSCAGVALAFAGHLFVEPPAWIGKLVKHGLDAGLLCASGLLAIGLGLTGRLVARTSRQVDALRDGQLDVGLAVDQTLAEVADVRSGVDHLASLPPPAPPVPPAPEAPERAREEREALFRMAASLDQLAGKLERRVHVDLEGLKKELERISAAVAVVQRRIDGLATRPAAPAAPAGPVPARPAQRPAAQRAPEGKARPAGRAPAPALPQRAPADEDDAVMIDLDAEEGLQLFDRMEGATGGDEPKAALPQQQRPAAPRPYQPGG